MNLSIFIQTWPWCSHHDNYNSAVLLATSRSCYTEPNDWLDSAVLYSWVIVDNDFNKLHCTLLRCYSCDQTIKHWATPTKIIVHTHGVGTIQGWDLIRSAQARWPVREQFKGGKNSRKYRFVTFKEIQYLLQLTHDINVSHYYTIKYNILWHNIIPMEQLSLLQSGEQIGSTTLFGTIARSFHNKNVWCGIKHYFN